jgi:hypothetical protein
MTDANPLPPRSEDYPPSRPGAKTLIDAAVVILIGAAVTSWPAISSLVHFMQIKDAIGL